MKQLQKKSLFPHPSVEEGKALFLLPSGGEDNTLFPLPSGGEDNTLFPLPPGGEGRVRGKSTCTDKHPHPTLSRKREREQLRLQRQLRPMLRALNLALLCLTLPAFAFDGRVTVRGLEACNTYADIDALIPFARGCNSLLYTDLQGKYTSNEDWFAGIGLGYRTLYGNQIFGGNLFIDYARSSRDHGFHDDDFNNNDFNDHHFHSHDYWILSPTLESIHCNWDLRLNGYIPVSRRRSNEGHFFPSGPNACGINGDPRFIQFTGHQQFEHRFLQVEEIGPGADLSAGINLPFLYCATLRGGAYYYHVDKDAHFKPNVRFRDDHKEDITGVAARFDLPISTNWAITSEASYDNQTHGEVAIGLRVQFGHTPPFGCCPNLCDRLYDPVYRHIGPIERGTGVPVVHGIKDEGFILRRDNIWFFSETGRGTSTTNAGTFENPLASNQLTSTTVDSIGNNAILFFNTGTFQINNTPNSTLNLLPGQSFFGRTDNFRLSAIGDDRPIILGGLLLDDPSVHILDSIQLINRDTTDGTTDQTVTALELENTTVAICNSLIKAEALVLGENHATNVALGIVANNSRAFIDRSEIIAEATVAGDNGSATTDVIAINAASAIGNFNADFTNNKFFINNSLVSGRAEVFGDNISSVTSGNNQTAISINMATSIGNDAAQADATENDTITANFTNNQFNITCSQINSLARVTGNNISTITDSFNNSAASFNLSATFGNNVAELVGATNNNINLIANFSDNSFPINCSELTSLAEVQGNNRSNVFVTSGDSNNTTVSVNSSVVIGNNAAEIAGLNNSNSNLTANFNNNFFPVNSSRIKSTAKVQGNNASYVGGGNPINNTAVSFNLSATFGNNAALAVGLLNSSTIEANFNHNFFPINCTDISSIAEAQDNISRIANLEERPTSVSINAASAIGNNAVVVAGNNNFSPTNISNFNNNLFSIKSSNINSIARVQNNTSNITDGVLVTTASFNLAAVIGNNIAAVTGSTNSQTTVIANFTENLFPISSSAISSLAEVQGNNTANIATPVGPTINSGNTAVSVNSSASAGNNVAMVAGAANTNTLIEADFSSNLSGIANSTLDSLAEILGDNISRTSSSDPNNTSASFNLAVTLGNNIALVTSFLNNNITLSTNYNNNLLPINSSEISSIAKIFGDNISSVTTTSSSNTAGSFNQAATIGNNVALVAGSNNNTISLTANFSGNFFPITFSEIRSLAVVLGENASYVGLPPVAESNAAASFNLAAVVGNNVAALISFTNTNVTIIANYIDNISSITNSKITSLAEIFGDNTAETDNAVNNISGAFNLATFLGNNVAVVAGASSTGNVTAEFAQNVIPLKCNIIEVNAVVRGDNEASGTNAAVFNSAKFKGNNAFLHTISTGFTITTPFEDNVLECE